MTKTLTEQWHEGTLPDGAYYILVDKYEQNEPEIDVGVCYNSNFEWWIVKEVLAPVPSYKDYKKLRKLPLKCFQLEENNSALMVINKDMCKEIERLQKQLAIATKALKEMVGYPPTNFNDCETYMWTAQQALKEMEGVK